MEDRWLGLIELVFTVVVVGLWVWRDRRGLERDIAARKARENAAREGREVAASGSGPDDIRPPPA